MHTFAVVRLLLLLIHVMAFAVAFGCVLREDAKLLSSAPLDRQSLRAAGRVVRCALAILWASGSALIVLDTDGVLSRVADNPKLLAKLSVVCVLTLNGFALHWLAFPALFGELGHGRRAAALAAALGAVSAASWLAATVLGIGRAQVKPFTYAELMTAYAAMLACALAIAFAAVRPLIQRKLRLRPEPLDAPGNAPSAAHLPHPQ